MASGEAISCNFSSTLLRRRLLTVGRNDMLVTTLSNAKVYFVKQRALLAQYLLRRGIVPRLFARQYVAWRSRVGGKLSLLNRAAPAQRHPARHRQPSRYSMP